MEASTKCKIIGGAWILFALIVLLAGYLYFLHNKDSALDLARCVNPDSRNIIESMQAPLDCSKKLPLENWISN